MWMTSCFPICKGFRTRAEGANTVEYKIGEIFSEIENKFRSGYSLRDALELMDGLSFRSQDQKHELSHIYEAKLRNMGNAGRNGGEYYTPRPLIRAMIQVVKPKIGERIYDGACGSAGFLCEAYDYLRAKAANLSTKDLQDASGQDVFRQGEEERSLTSSRIMNMILHGIEAPNIIHTNTLAENINDIQEKDRYDVVLANPPFGGKERPEVQQNFPIKTGETAFLFLQHFIKIAEGRWSRRHRYQEHVPVEHRQRLGGASQGASGELQSAHRVGHAERARFRAQASKPLCYSSRRALPTRKVWFYKLRSRPQSRQDQPAQRRRPEGFRRVAGKVQGQREVVDGGCQEHRQGHL